MGVDSTNASKTLRVDALLTATVDATVAPTAAADASVPSSSGPPHSAPPSAESSVASSPVASGCPADMVEVKGTYCTSVQQVCTPWLDEKPNALRCAEFAEDAPCVGKLAARHFCIDRYEYPNKAGELPRLMVSWYQARDLCAAQGKRLCGDSEWTLACEGQSHSPYPYGRVRDDTACNIDKPHRTPNTAAIADPRTRAAEVARLDQREASGSRPGCVSPFGVFDMTGNVDEWVVNERGAPYQSGLKGGYWGPVRTRCRPMTTAHNDDFFFYQIGFRCCRNPDAGESAPR